MKINKTFLQFIAALWILLFHLWINMSGSLMEQFFIKIGYVGVDIFFLVSAFSLSDGVVSYSRFIKNRFSIIYSKFVLFAVLAFLINNWSFAKLIKTLSFLSFFEKGGGSFLWFIPAIMLLYLTFPPFLNWQCKHKTIIVLIIYIIVNTILQYVFGYTKVFILTNRIPVILIGYSLKKVAYRKWFCLAGIPIGICALYFHGFQHKLNIPFSDFYFVLAIPLVLGIAWFSQEIPHVKILSLVAKSSLEIYAMQMIIGATLANFFYKIFQNILFTNLFVIISILATSVILARLLDFIGKKINFLWD